MNKLSRTKILFASVAAGVSGLWFYRNLKFNRYLELTKERVARSTGADKPIPLSSLSSCMEPVKFIYDSDDKQLKYNRLKTFADILKAGLVELVPDEDEEQTECAKCCLLTCKRESLPRHMARIVARQQKGKTTNGICFVFIYPEKPKVVLEKLELLRQYISGRPQWVDNFASAGILLSNWICSLAHSVCPLVTDSKSRVIPTDSVPLLLTKTEMNLALEDASSDSAESRDFKSNVWCALSGIVVQNGYLRFMTKEKVKNSDISLLHPRTWLDLFRRNRVECVWTDWTCFDNLKLTGCEHGSFILVNMASSNDLMMDKKVDRCEIKQVSKRVRLLQSAEQAEDIGLAENESLIVEPVRSETVPSFILVS